MPPGRRVSGGRGNLSAIPAEPYIGVGRAGAPLIPEYGIQKRNRTSDESPPVGAREPLDQVVALTYQDLRAIAHRRLAAREHGGTLSTTALVHEAYLKLFDQAHRGWQDVDSAGQISSALAASRFDGCSVSKLPFSSSFPTTYFWM